MTKLWIVPALLAALSSCAGPTLHSAPQMPDSARVCSQRSQALCLTELQRAVERGDRMATGQLLVVAASAAPAEQRRDIVRAALWLAPEAWLPNELRALLTDDDLQLIAASSGASSKLRPGTVLALRGAAAVIPAGWASVNVQLAMPSGAGPLAGDSLAVIVAAASGADAALYSDTAGQRLVAAAPLLSRVLGTGVTVGADSWAAAKLLSQADRALRDGHQAEAYLLIKRAQEQLPGSSPPCSSRGVLAYLRATVARLAFEGSDSDAASSLRAVCTDAVVPAQEQPMKRYLKEILALQTNLSTAPSELPAPWSTPSDLRAWSGGIDELARSLDDRRATILRALRDDLVARASQPDGRCDDSWSERVKVQREAAKQALRAAGREDLALPAVQSKIDGARVEVVDADTVLAWTQRPENRWVRVPALAGILTDPALALAGEAYRPAIDRICSTAFDELLQEIKSDRLDGYDDRNVARWYSASRGITLCRRADAIAPLSDELLQGALQGKGGKAGALKVLMLTGFQALEAVLSGRAAEGMLAVKVLKDGLDRLSRQLGPGDEDRVLDAVIGVVSSGVDRVMSQSGDLPVALERAAAVLEPIARRPIRPDAPELVKAAPGIHLAALALLAAIDAADQDTRGRDAALLRLQSSVDRDVQALLSAFGVPEQGPAILRIVNAASMLARATDNAQAPDADTLMREVEAASAPGAKEDRWWGVGLNTARLILWDLALGAISKSAAGGDKAKPAAGPGASLEPRTAKALDSADKVLVRLSDEVVGGWGTSWEFLYLTPAIHRGVAAMILAPEGAPDIGERAATAMQGSLDTGLERMSKTIRDAPADQVGFLAVLIDALELAHEEGGVPALAKQAEARVRWARKLRAMASSYPAEYRIVIHAATAAAEFDADSKLARQQLQDAAKEAANSQFGDVAWLPRLVEAVLLYHDDDPAAALQAVDQAIAEAKAAAPCNKPHEVTGLLPFRAWALERTGKHADADKTLSEYLDATRVFGADGFIECRMVSYRKAFTFTVDVKQRVGSVLFPTSSEGTFQVGAGYGDARDYDRLACVSSPILTPRLDLAMTAQLMRAAYALRAGDDATANTALLGAMSAGRAMVHGDVASLGLSDGAVVEEARKNAFIPMMAYVAAAARSRGHLAAADQLETLAVDVASARADNVPASLASRAGMPGQLAHLGFDALEPIVSLAWEQPPEARDAGGTKEPKKPVAAASPAPEASALPSWSKPLLDAYALMRRSNLKEAGAAINRAHAPRGNAVAAIAIARARANLAAAKGSRRGAVSQAELQTLAQARMFTEVQSLVSEQVAALIQAKRTADAIAALDNGLALIPPDAAPLARADLLLDAAAQWPEMANHAGWVSSMASVEPSLQGRIPLQQEVAVLQRILSYTVQSADPGPALPHLERLRGVLERALGADHPEAVKLAVAELMLRSFQAQPRQAEVDEVIARVHKLGAAGEPLLNVIDAWRATSARPQERKTVVVRFVQQVFTP